MGSNIFEGRDVPSIKKPNFLVIVADGFSDCGCFGSEIKTPHIDSLSDAGTRFTDFHAASACSPSRAMLMTGTDHHYTGLGQMVELISGAPVYKGQPGHEGYLNEHCATLPEVLRSSGGYHTIMSGKWHLGVELEHCPDQRGFDRSFALLAPAANHFAWEPELAEGGPLPHFAKVNVTALHAEDGAYFDNQKLPKDFYSSDFYVDKLMQQLDERPEKKPFFAYLPFTAPHWPLQAQKEDIKPYRGQYDDGPAALRKRRLQALQQLGLIPKDVKPHPITAPEIPPWRAMTPDQRAKSARSMEAYAGMVSRMDHNIGRVISYLKQHGLYDNTQIIFMSDNGAEGYSYERPITTNPVHKYLEKYYDNSLDNIGTKTSFVWYGGRWAQAATAPSRLYKKYSTEGGVRVPLILKPIVGFPVKQSICHEFCTIQDVMPTLLSQAGIEVPKNHYNGRAIRPIRGASWLTFLEGDVDHLHPEDCVAGWELFGQKALRKGHWKINNVKGLTGTEGRWQLHNLAIDPGEVEDVADKNPGKRDELLEHWRQYVTEVGVIEVTPEMRAAAKDRIDEMGNPVVWMKYETSRSVVLREQKKCGIGGSHINDNKETNDNML